MNRLSDARSVLCVSLLAAVAMSLSQTAQSSEPPQPLSIRSVAGVNPDNFQSTVFASGLDFPFGMQALEDGSLLFGSSRPLSEGSYFQSTGQLLRLRDRDGDGRADGVPEVLYSGLPGVVTAVRKSGDLVFVTSVEPGSERISVLRQKRPLGTPFQFLGAMHFVFPAGWEHTTYALAVRRSAHNVHELIFNVGSSANDGQSSQTVSLSGLASGVLQGASLYRVTLRDGRNSIAGSTPLRIASGLRNAAGIAFNPATGDLHFQDNGIDDPVVRSDQRSVDELNMIARGAIGGAVESFGFPENYIQYRTGAIVGGAGVQPTCAFQPLGSPASESEGAVEIAFAPSRFPAAMRGGVFVGFYGEYGKVGIDNAENPVVFCDPASGRYSHFIGNDEPGVAHLTGMLATPDSLWLAELSRTGDLGPGGAGQGVIYRIRARPRASR